MTQNRNNPGIIKGVNPREHLSVDQKGRKVEIALQTNGTVRTNSATDTYNPLLMGFVPQDSTFSSVMTNLVLGEPEGRGFVVSESFLRARVEVEVNGVVKTTPQRAKSPRQVLCPTSPEPKNTAATNELVPPAR